MMSRGNDDLGLVLKKGDVCVDARLGHV